MASYTAQNALSTFLEARKTQNISVDLNYLIQRETLEIASEREIEANKIESEQLNQQQRTATKTDLISRLKQLGFAADNSLSDWQKIYNYPEIYGSKWNDQAIFQHSISTGIDYFLNQVVNSYIMKYYEIGKRYLIGDTFIYNSELFKVIQSHTSQIDWIPSSTPSLYLKIVAEGVIPDWKQPTGAQDAYNIGDKVRFNGMNYQSLINGNVWSPTAYPAGWKLV